MASVGPQRPKKRKPRFPVHRSIADVCLWGLLRTATVFNIIYRHVNVTIDTVIGRNFISRQIHRRLKYHCLCCPDGFMERLTALQFIGRLYRVLHSVYML
jgi:hypothetical protein